MAILYRKIRHVTGNIYDLWRDEGQVTITPDTPEYFTWLATVKSFHFEGKTGHFTAQPERKKNGESYWYAYRKANKHQFKQYLGTIDKLTTNRLEEVAGQIAEKASQTPALKKNPRTPPVPKEDLRRQIEAQKETIQHQQARIQKLEEEVKALEKEVAVRGHELILEQRKNTKEPDYDF